MAERRARSAYLPAVFPSARFIGRIPASVGILFALALLLRLGFVAWHARLGWQLKYDPSYYLTLAENLRHGAYALFHPRDIPDTTHLPGYPFLLFLLRGDVLGVLLVQALASALKVPLVHAIGQRIGLGQRWALAAAGLMAVEPLDILFAGQVLTEALFTTALLVALWALLARPGWTNALICAMGLAACAWLRPNGALLIAWVPLVGMLVLRQGWHRSLAIASLASLLVLPWAVRHHRVTGRWALGDGGVVAVAYFHVPDVLGQEGEASTGYRSALKQQAAGTDWEDRAAAADFHARLRSTVRQVLVDHPFAWARQQLKKSARILLAPGRGHLSVFFPDQPMARALMLAVSIAFTLVIVIALGVCALAWRSMPRSLAALLLIAAALLLTGGLSVPEARFKVPAMPSLLLAVAWAGQWALRRIQRATAPAAPVRA
jgi:hypothetical protein